MRKGIRLGGVCTALAVQALGPVPSVAQERALRGELLHRSGEAATEVRLVVVGHPPEVVIRDGGLFRHPLTGDPIEVTVRVVGAPELEVLYPPDGRTPLPADPDAVVPIVVGRRIGPAVEDRIDEDLRALRETLEVRGVSEAEIQSVVRTEMDGLVVRIAAITEGAVGRAVAGADRAELRERIGGYLRTYLRTGRDLVDAFGLIDVGSTLSQANFLALYNAMGSYSDAYAELDAALGEAPEGIRRAWPGAAGVQRSQGLSKILHRLETEVHEPVLRLREPLLVIQAEHNGGDPDGDDVRRARRAVRDVLPDLDAGMVRLDAEVPPFLESLRGP